MTKTQILSLEDYINSNSAMDLKLFVLSVNPSAKPDKELKALISKYKSDRSKIRLGAIFGYLVGITGKTSSKTSKPTSPPISYLPKTISTPEQKAKLDELTEAKAKYVKNLGRQGSKAAIEENEVLRQKIDDMEFELGLRFDYKDLPAGAAEESEKSLLLSILGDWENTASISWELLNGQKAYFEVADSGKQNTTAFGMLGLVRSLEKFSGRKIRPFNIEFVFPQGNAAAKAKWTFSLNPTMSSVQMMTNTMQQEGFNSDLTKLNV